MEWKDSKTETHYCRGRQKRDRSTINSTLLHTSLSLVLSSEMPKTSVQMPPTTVGDNYL